jgi:hypothetical protein
MILSFFAGIWLIGNALSMSGIGELWVKNRRWVDQIPKSPDPKTPIFVFHGISNGEIVKDHIKTSEPRKKPQCIVYVRELYYITFAKEKCWVAKDRESNLLRERSRKRSLRYFKLFVLFSGNGPVGS